VSGGLSFQRRFHREEVVSDSRGARFLVRVARAGVYRFTFNGLAFPAIAYSWIRYLVKQRKAWTVQVRAGRFWLHSPGDLLYEEFEDRPSAALRADEVANRIASGEWRPD
jgi:hypothetical protein